MFKTKLTINLNYLSMRLDLYVVILELIRLDALNLVADLDYQQQ